jgi:hypothetical protein
LDTSYNDQIWSVMMKRGRDHGYTLPADKSREEGSKKSKSAPQPMPAAKVKADWQGETKKALLKKADLLPQGVRDCPRAYLVPPCTSAAGKKSQAWKETNLKRKGGADVDSRPPSGFSKPPSGFSNSPFGFSNPPSDLSMVAPRHQPSPPKEAFERPPADPVHGEVVSTCYGWKAGDWMHTHASGAIAIGTTATGTATVAPSPDIQSPAIKKRRNKSSGQGSTPMEADSAAINIKLESMFED